MADKKLVELLDKDVQYWNEWRNSTRIEFYRDASKILDLRGIDLSCRVLIGADFSNTNLEEANFSGSILRSANFGIGGGEVIYEDEGITVLGGGKNTILRGARLMNSSLVGVFFDGTDLTGADFSRASVIRATLNYATLDGTIFDKAQFGATKMINVDLSKAKGLDLVTHEGFSNIGIEVLYLSQGKIPDIFLRGCGMPDTLITYVGSLVGKPIEYYSCFISYSSLDKEFAEQLYADLQAKGIRCWFAPEDLKIGDRIRPSIDEAIRLHDKLLVVLSSNSIGSAWVEKEVETAFEKEAQQKKTVLFPIRLDDTVMKSKEAWAADIKRTRHIGDFSNWKNHDEYQKSITRLVKDLKNPEMHRMADS